MSAPTITCSACGAEVGADRIICPDCGAIAVPAPASEIHPAPVETDPEGVPGHEPGGDDPAAAGAFAVDWSRPPADARSAGAPPFPPAAAEPSGRTSGLPPSFGSAEAPAPPSPEPLRPGEAPLLADLPFGAPSDLPGWLVASGAGIGMIGFFLPWAPQVFGSSGFGRYIDSWGFATLAHLPAFLVAGLVVGLSLVPNRVPTWFRTGVLALVLGGYLLGIVWPYLFGGFGGQIGAIAEGVAAVVLIVGGALEVSPGRSRGGAAD